MTREDAPRPVPGPAPTPSLPWRDWVREAVFELDPNGRILSLSPGAVQGLADWGRCEGLYLVDRMRASDRVVFLHAASRSSAGEMDVSATVSVRFDEAGREWRDCTLRFVSLEGRTIVLMEAARSSTDAEWQGVSEDVLEERSALDEATLDETAPDNDADDDTLPELAHELRTPLNAIMGYAQALEAELFGALSPRQREAVVHIAEASEHLVEVANTVLDGARLSRGASEVTPVRGRCAGEAARACAMVAGLAERSGVTVANRITGRDDEAHFDGAALRQIVVNLLSNAVKASERGGVVSLDLSRAQGGVSLSVRDEGRGMSAKEVEAVQGTVRRRPGADGETGGLGLALVRRLVAAHGGRLAMRSEPGRGTLVSVFLPDVAGENGAEANLARNNLARNNSAQSDAAGPDTKQGARMIAFPNRSSSDRNGTVIRTVQPKMIASL